MPRSIPPNPNPAPPHQVIRDLSINNQGTDWHLKEYCHQQYPFVHLYRTRPSRNPKVNDELRSVWAQQLALVGIKNSQHAKWTRNNVRSSAVMTTNRHGVKILKSQRFSREMTEGGRR